MTTPVSPAVFDALTDAVAQEVLGRRRELRAIMVALVAKTHVFILSRPGEAKTYMIERLLIRVDGSRRFSTQVDAFSDDSELFGNWSVKAIRDEDRRRRSEAVDQLQHAHVADIDEIDKASMALLNALLRITNERQWRDDGQWKTAPLSTLIAGANRVPWADKDPDRADKLAAIADRIGIRLWMDPTPITLMRSILELPVPDPAPRQLLTWDEVVAAQAAAAALPITPQAMDELDVIFTKLARKGIALVSPRRGRLMLDVIRANAWLAGASKVDVAHLDILTTVFPLTPAQQADVNLIVLANSAPLRADIIKVENSVAELTDTVREAKAMEPGRERTARGTEAFGKLGVAADKLARLEIGAGPADLTDIDSLWPRLQGLHGDIIKAFLNNSSVPDLRIDAVKKARAAA